MFRYLSIGCLLIGLLLNAKAYSDDAIVGYVKTTTPKAFLIHKQHTELAQVGSPVSAGVIIKTDAEGTLGLALKDDTLLSFGPDTEFEIKEFLFQPSDERLKLDMKLLKGTLQYISGIISKLKPDAISVQTPTGIIGVRGTRFVVKVDD